MAQGVRAFRTATHMQCTVCGELKELSMFPVWRRAKNGRASQCKCCAYRHCVRWRRVNHQKYVQQARARRVANREREKQISTRYWSANRGKQAKYQKEYAKKNPKKVAAHNTVYRALRRGELTRPELCSACGRRDRIQSHHDDYSLPLAVTWLCQPCHKALHRVY